MNPGFEIILNHFFNPKKVEQFLKRDYIPKEFYEFVDILERSTGLKRDLVFKFTGMPADPYGIEGDFMLTPFKYLRNLVLSLSTEQIMDLQKELRISRKFIIYHMDELDDYLSEWTNVQIIKAVKDKNSSFDLNHKYFIGDATKRKLSSFDEFPGFESRSQVANYVVSLRRNKITGGIQELEEHFKRERHLQEKWDCFIQTYLDDEAISEMKLFE